MIWERKGLGRCRKRTENVGEDVSNYVWREGERGGTKECMRCQWCGVGEGVCGLGNCLNGICFKQESKQKIMDI